MNIFYLLLTVLQISPAMNVFSLNTNITPIAVVGENLNKKKNVMCLNLREKNLLGIVLLL